MPHGHRARDIANLKVQLLTAILKLEKFKIPVAAIWYHENQVQVEGTESLKNVLDEMKHGELEKAIKEDMFKFAASEPTESSLVVPDEIPIRTQAHNLSFAREPERLPYPLSAMNKKDKITWLVKEIRQEQRQISGASITTVRYGDPAFKPSFWLNDEWDWTLCQKNLGNVTNEMYTGPGEFQNFLARLIHSCLSQKGKDPEKFVVENSNKKKSNEKKKTKGTHIGSHIVHSEEISMDIIENEDAPEAGYIAPSVIEAPSFRPRRTLPDETLPRYPGCAPLPPGANPVTAPATAPVTPQQPSEPNPSLYREEIRFQEPVLSISDFEYLWDKRTFVKPPQFLQQLPEPLHPGWKSLENEGGGPCLFRSAADHIFLKDFKLLRKYVSQHIVDNWFLYSHYFSFPVSVKIGSGNASYRKLIRNEQSYLDFVKSDESLYSWNTSDTEIIALGNILKVDIIMLTYNIQGRPGTQAERTEWKVIKFNPDVTVDNVFSVRAAGEHLRILHQDEVHFTKLVWLPDSPDLVDQTITLNRTSTKGSLTRQISKDNNIQRGLSVEFVTDCSFITDQFQNKKK